MPTGVTSPLRRWLRAERAATALPEALGERGPIRIDFDTAGRVRGYSVVVSSVDEVILAINDRFLAQTPFAPHDGEPLNPSADHPLAPAGDAEDVERFSVTATWKLHPLAPER